MASKTLTKSEGGEDIYDDGYLRIEHRKYYISCGGTPLYNLSATEFLLLSSLAYSIDSPTAPEALWGQVWGADKAFNLAMLRVYITNLRRKISPYGINIVMMAEAGYQLEDTQAR